MRPLLSFACACLLAGLVVATPGSAAPDQGFVRTRGQEFVGPDGAPYRIRGISLGGWMVPEGYMFGFTRALSPHEIDAVFAHALGTGDTGEFWRQYRDNFVTRADIDFLAAAGFNTIRIPLHFGLFLRDGPVPAYEGPGYALLDRVIGWCRADGIRVILDMHAAPGGQTGVNHDDGTGFPLVFYVPRYRRETIELWRRLAARYADEPAVLGYDLLNEPISPYNDEDFLNPRLEALYQDIAAAVRAVDANHILFLEGAQWSSNFSVFTPLLTENTAYSYHMFWAAPRRASIQSFVDFSDRFHVPLLLGESGESSNRWNSAFRQLHDSAGIGWSFWTYKNMDPKSVAVVTPPAQWDAMTALGDSRPAAWGKMPPAPGVVAAYLEAIKFGHAAVNCGYLASLGLRCPVRP